MLLCLAMEGNISLMLSQVGRLMRRSFDESARSIGVTRPQWLALSLLIRHEGIHQGRLASILGVEPITLGRMIDRLQNAGLAERRFDPSDRRTRRVFITAKGSELFDRLRPLAQQNLANALVGLNDSELEGLIVMLAKIRSNLSGNMHTSQRRA